MEVVSVPRVDGIPEFLRKMVSSPEVFLYRQDLVIDTQHRCLALCAKSQLLLREEGIMHHQGKRLKLQVNEQCAKLMARNYRGAESEFQGRFLDKRPQQSREIPLR